MLAIDEKLYEYCTPSQRETLEAIVTHGSALEASLSLGKNRGHASEVLKSVRHKAAKNGYAPDFDMKHPVPDGFTARDAYAARGAWFADREICSITYHRKFDQGLRAYACPEMLGAA